MCDGGPRGLRPASPATAPRWPTDEGVAVRVLFSSTFGYGHMFPMYPLARAFLAAGHDVLWAASGEVCDRLEAAGLPAAPAGLTGPELHERVRSLQARVAEVSPPLRAAFMYPRLFGETLTPSMTADLLPLATRWEPDLLVHEHGELAWGPSTGRPCRRTPAASRRTTLTPARRRCSPCPWTTYRLGSRCGPW